MTADYIKRLYSEAAGFRLRYFTEFVAETAECQGTSRSCSRRRSLDPGTEHERAALIAFPLLIFHDRGITKILDSGKGSVKDRWAN